MNKIFQGLSNALGAIVTFTRRKSMMVPNIKDIAGLGEIVGHLRSFVLKILEMFRTKEELRLRNVTLRLENTLKFLRMAKQFGLTPLQLKSYEMLVNDGEDKVTFKDNPIEHSFDMEIDISKADSDQNDVPQLITRG